MTVFPAHSSDRWEMTASLAQLGAGFIQPFAGGTAMAGRAAKGERNGQAQRLSLKRWYETVTISKQLDSDRRAAYVPDIFDLTFPLMSSLVLLILRYVVKETYCNSKRDLLQ